MLPCTSHSQEQTEPLPFSTTKNPKPDCVQTVAQTYKAVVLYWCETRSILYCNRPADPFLSGLVACHWIFWPQKTVLDDYCWRLNLKTKKEKSICVTTREKRCAFTAARSTHTGLNIYGMAERTKGMPPGWPLTFGIDFPRLERGCWLRK